MSYLSGKKVVDQAGVMQNVITLIEQAMSEAEWVFVEVHSGWRVWKCPASLNGIQDFHVALSFSTSFLYFLQFEEYNPTMHQFRRGMANLANSSTVPAGSWDATTQSIYGQVWTNLPLPGTLIPQAQLSSWGGLPTAQFDYVVRCGSKHLMFSIAWPGSASNQGVGRWVGLFDSIIEVPENDPMPFAMFDIWSTNSPANSGSGNSATFGATSRTPLPATDTSWMGINIIHGGLNPSTGLPFASATGSTTSQFNTLGGSADAWRAPTEIGQKYIVHNVRHSNDGRMLLLRGKVPGVVSFGAGVGLYIGDEFTFDGATYSVISYAPWGMGLAVDKAFAG